jgi:hypothetical protein
MRLIHRLFTLVLMSLPLGVAVGAGWSCGGSGNSSGGQGGQGGHATTQGTGGKGQQGGGGTSGTAGGKGSGGNGGSCLNVGAACTSGSECCTSTCTNGVCNLGACTSDGDACTKDSACCSGTCGSNGKCTPLNTQCKTLGNSCAGSGDCCSGLCLNDVCSASSFCGQNGDICSQADDCCGGACDKPDGGNLGTCGTVPGGSSNCSMPDGVLCDGGQVTDGSIPECGGGCCSRLCAPYGPTGVMVCQPATGCHVVGDLCRQDTDCCGSAGLPGGSHKPVTCDISPGFSVGVCRNPMGCKPDGDVCKLATMSCNASCDCCSGNCENEDTCKVDQVGVPRCSAMQCANPGEACASGANCCNGLPCVPNPSGNPPYVCGSTACVGACGLCTSSADCCPGTSCQLEPGSAMGTCGPCGGQDGGTGGNGAGGGLADGGPGCATYGQTCTMSSQCCDNIPCSNSTGLCTGGPGCTCHVVIH